MAELIEFPSQPNARPNIRTLRLDEETMWQINDCLASLVSIAAELKSVLDRAIESRGA